MVLVDFLTNGICHGIEEVCISLSHSFNRPLSLVWVLEMQVDEMARTLQGQQQPFLHLWVGTEPRVFCNGDGREIKSI